MFYSIALFLHIVGALGLFAALALEWTSLFYLRRSVTVEQVRSWMNVLSLVRRLGPTSLVFILLPGFYMMATVWGGVPWIVVTLAAILLFPLLGAFSGIRLAAIGRSVETEAGLLAPVVRRQLRNPLFWISVQMRTMIATGIVFLMVVKPDLAGSLATIALASVLGLLLALPLRYRSQEPSPAN
jgi:hypothetical protein